MRYKTGEFVNTDPVSRLLHPVVLSEVERAGLEERRVVGALLLVWSLELAENGDEGAATLARRLGDAIRP